MTANLTILVVVKEPSRDHIKQYRDHQGTILGTVKELNNVVRVSFSISILKLAEVSDCNDSMRKVVVILFFVLFFYVLFFFRGPRKKFCASHYAKTVKGRKISKTDLDSCHSEALQD